MTAAIVDVGSNTVRLLVARLGVDGLERVCTEGARIGLGADIEDAGRVSDVKIAAAAKAVRKLCALARKEGAETLEVVVTAPGRQSANGHELVVALERAAGLPVRVVSSDEEARLAFAGAVASAAPTASLVAVCDLGGASTEIAIGEPGGEPSWVRSIDLGALRLTARALDCELPPPQAVAAAREIVADTFAELTPPLPGEALAVGGSARGLRKLVGEMLGPDELEAAERLLVSTPHAEIARGHRIDRRRAPLLLAAALILAEVQRRLAVPLQVVDGGVREGALLASLDELAA